MVRAILLFALSALIALVVCACLASDDFYSLVSLYACMVLLFCTGTLAKQRNDRKSLPKTIFLAVGGLMVVVYALMILFANLGVSAPLFYDGHDGALLKDRVLSFIALYFSALSLGYSAYLPKRRVIVVRRSGLCVSKGDDRDGDAMMREEECESFR